MGEVDEGEGRKPSWFTGKTHHTLSAIKSSHALRSVQELASNGPHASSDWRTDQKSIHSPGIWQRRNSEMWWLFLQCSGSEWIFGWFSNQKKHVAHCWRVLVPIEVRGLILWLKVCGVFFP